MRKAEKLRELFNNPGVIRIVGAHDGLTAKLVERNGFDGIWASGLEISTSYAVPDASILSMSQYLERAVEMDDAVSIPVITDCDTGFGNSNNVIHMVKKYEAAGIAAVCIEDKRFPKVNSLLFKGRQELVSIAEFVGKIMAAKNAQATKDFMVFARVEALIAGWGQEEALKRAYAYVKAGADAISIHSKTTSPQPIIDFAKSWDNSVPLIIVPTTYSAITFKQIEELGIKMVIYANQGLRAAIKATDSVLAKIYKEKTTLGVEDKITSLKEVFELQGMPQLKESEKIYLKTGREPIKIVMPAAGAPHSQESLEPLLKERPLCMLDINGKSLLQRNCETLNRAGINDITIIIGYQHEKVDIDNVNVIVNNAYNKKYILHSIMLAEEKFDGKTLLVYSDILFDKHLIDRILEVESDIILVVDASFKRTHQRNRKLDLVVTGEKSVLGKRAVTCDKPNSILKIGESINDEEGDYEFIGMALFSAKGIEIFKEEYHKAKEKYKTRKFQEAQCFSQASFTDMIQEMINNGHKVSALEVNSGWMEIHTFDDYKQACLITRFK